MQRTGSSGGKNLPFMWVVVVFFLINAGVIMQASMVLPVHAFLRNYRPIRRNKYRLMNLPFSSKSGTSPPACFTSTMRVTCNFGRNEVFAKPVQPSTTSETAPQQHSKTRLFASKSSSSDTTTSAVTTSLTDQFHALRRAADDALTSYQEINKSTTPLPVVLQRVRDLEQESSQPEFWDDSKQERAKIVTAQLSQSTRLAMRLQNWQQWRGDIEAALEMLQDMMDIEEANGNTSSGESEMLLEELEISIENLRQDLEQFQLEQLFTGPYDDASCRLLLTAGAGGTEANDWVADLKRMYERHASAKGYKCQTLDQQPGDVVGFKSVELLIEGTSPGMYPFGWFQSEKGAHRLVRISPFNAQNKRQTTFAGVDVAPDLSDMLLELSDVEIDDKELEITTMKSGGKGGQNVNKVETAVRIKHIPSGLQVKCSQHRTQPQNKELALKRLKAQLLAIAQEQQVQEIKDIRGDMVEATWGAQIRNYVLHPYKMVKDARTGWESSNTQEFLDGGDLLQDCMTCWLRHHHAQLRAEEDDEN